MLKSVRSKSEDRVSLLEYSSNMPAWGASSFAGSNWGQDGRNSGLRSSAKTASQYCIIRSTAFALQLDTCCHNSIIWLQRQLPSSIAQHQMCVGDTRCHNRIIWLQRQLPSSIAQHQMCVGDTCCHNSIIWLQRQLPSSIAQYQMCVQDGNNFGRNTAP